MVQFEDIGYMAEVMWKGVTTGNWWMVAAAALVLIVIFVRRSLGKRIPWIATDRGGVLLALVGGTAFGVAVALAGGEAIALSIVLTAAKVAFVGIGGFSALRKLIWPDPKPKEYPSLKPATFVPSASGGAPQAVDAENPK